MAALSGTLLASRIVPTDSEDTFATHDAFWGRDGHRSLDTLADRDAITAQRRKEGMTVWVISEQKEYRLIGGIENSNWKKVNTNYTSLTEITDPLDTDYVVLGRNGAEYKVSIAKLKEIFGGGSSIPTNAVLYNGVVVTYNGQTVTY